MWLWLSAWVPVVFCLAVIGLESTVAFGSDHTSQPLQRLLEWLLSRHFTQPQWWRLHYEIRKVGHFVGYGLLSLAGFRAVWMTLLPGAEPSRRRLAAHGLAMLGTLFVASCDEFHQTLLPNRTGSGWDVLLDFSGAALLQFLVWLWTRRRAELRS